MEVFSVPIGHEGECAPKLFGGYGETKNIMTLPAIESGFLEM
jgi:hypothetical protein